MPAKQIIQDFIKQLQVYSDKKLKYPAEVGELMQIAVESGLVPEFDELIFQAKFLVKAHAIINRIGAGGEGFQKLSSEFIESMKKTIAIIKKILEKSAGETGQKYNDTFLNDGPDYMHKLMDLLSDLNWVKNWQVDGKPLPYNK
jgi:hypothetical protein